MQITEVAAIYFSATGNTKQVVGTLARRLAKNLGVPLKLIDFTVPADRKQIEILNKTTCVVFGVPVYAGRVPNKVLPMIRRLFHAEGSPAVAVVTYGNRSYDDGLIELCNVLKENGLHIVGAAAIPAMHAFTDRLAPGRPSEHDLEQLEQFAGEIAEIVVKTAAEQTGTGKVTVPGHDHLDGYYTPLGTDGQPAVFLKAVPKTKPKACTLCGVCQSLCPMGSIQVDKAANTVTMSGICIKCHACIRRCPNGARYFDDPAFLSHVSMLERNYTGNKQPEFYRFTE